MLVGIASAMLTTFYAIQARVDDVVGQWVPVMERRVTTRIDSMATAHFDRLNAQTNAILYRIDSLRNDVAAMPPMPTPPRPRITVAADTAGQAVLQHRLDQLEGYQMRILQYLEEQATERTKGRRTLNRRGQE